MDQNIASANIQIPNDPFPQTLRVGAFTASQVSSHNLANFSQSPSRVHSNGNYIGISDSANIPSEYYHIQPQQLTQPIAASSLSQGSMMVGQSLQDSIHRGPRVDDALSYLDQVRQQFSENPDVYNDFLEVMKEFKSHTIDTQGVIRRVSRLFSGHSNLITGFNTFLPPGYEVRVSGSTIRIIEPNGETTIVNNAIEQHPRSHLEPQQDVASIQQSMQSSLLKSASDALHTQRIVENEAVQAIAAGTSNAANFVAPTDHLQGHSLHPFSLPDIRQIAEAPSARSVTLLSPQQVSFQLSTAIQHVKQQAQLEVEQGESGIQSENKDITPMFVNATAQQPLHFDQAVGYLNKIKERFANRPEIYREFLSILGNYQRITNDQLGKLSMTETEVYQAVTQLFHDEEDLMQDFKSFLPDAGLESSDKHLNNLLKDDITLASLCIVPTNATLASSEKSDSENMLSTKIDALKLAKKRLPEINTVNANAKKAKASTKIDYELSMEKCLENIPLKDFVFFERIHKALKSETVVKNFFRCLLLYNKSLVSRHELVELATPFLSEHPDLLRQFNEILGIGSGSLSSPNKLEKVEQRLLPNLALQIDYSTCKRLGVSYRSLPDSYERSVSSGRTKLCDSVLNDTWVSFPSWSSESTESVSSKKSVFEDFMYRTEDERFEVDILIEVNSAAISALELVKRKIETMKLEEIEKFKLEPNYGCNSPTLMGRAVKKLYGEHATKVLEGLRDNPAVAVPQVLKRLCEKDAEWRSVREEFNAIWRDQIDKNYLKSLDHQAISFKANDLKFLRSKAIIQQLETFYDERQARIETGEQVENGPHLILEYPDDVSVIHDANELLIHHVKRQQNIPKKEKFMIKKLLRVGLIPRLFNLDLETMSDDEEESEINEKAHDSQVITRRTRRLLEAKLSSRKTLISTIDSKIQSAGYTLFFGTSCWLIFIRLHHIICERLARLKRRWEELLKEYEFEKQIQERQDKIYQKHGRSLEYHCHNAVDVHLGLRYLKKPLQNPEHFYATLIHELKNVLDGIIDSANFEDTLRSMFGTSAYVMFTMDKLIATITRQMQHFVTEEASVNAMNLFYKYCSHRLKNDGQPLVILDEQYEGAAEKIIMGQNCYKMFFMYLQKPTLSVELINTDADEEEEESGDESFVNLSKWTKYVEKYAGDDIDQTSCSTIREPFLLRNIVVRKLKAESSFDPFLPPTQAVSNSFYVNDGLRAVLSAKNLRLLYERGTSDVLVKRRNTPMFAKKKHREMFERRRLKFQTWLSKKYEKSLSATVASTSSEALPAIPSSERGLLDNTKNDFKWFTMNCRSILYRHRDFEYITYTRYFTLQQPTVLPPVLAATINFGLTPSVSPSHFTTQQ